MSSVEQPLQAERRSLVGKKVRRLRREGTTPGVLYGPNVSEPMNIQFNTFELEKYVRGIEESSLVTVQVDGEEYKVLFKDIARHSVKPEIISVDLYAPNLEETVTSPVMLEFVGSSEAVDVYGGLLIKNKTEVEVEALPADLPEHIQVDLTGLQYYEDLLRVEDIEVPDGVKLLNGPEEVVAIVEDPRKQQQEPDEEEVEATEEEEEPESEEV